MNAKANSIGIVPAMTLAERIHGIDEAVASVALARAVRSEDARSSAERRLGLALRSADQRAGEFWETLSYMAIWLCGLIGVGLCLL